MKEWGVAVSISQNLMREIRKRNDLERIYKPLRYPLEQKGCRNITISEPELEDLYEQYDEDGNGVGEPVKAWLITAFGETDE